MRFLDEYRKKPACLADHLPWAALVAPGVVLNKDGSFLTAFSFRGPDLESSTEDELMAVRARLNNALKRLGTGWCVHMEARRRPASPYPESVFDLDAAWLVDAERRERFEAADPAFETDYRLSLTWLPPADETRRMERWLYNGLERNGRDWTLSLQAFEREAGAVEDMLADALPEIDRLQDDALLSWLHACASSRSYAVRTPETPMFLDAWLADDDLIGGVAPRLGSKWLKVVALRGLPSTTRPGLLDALGTLPFEYRWTARWLGLDKVEAETEIVKLRKRWFANGPTGPARRPVVVGRHRCRGHGTTTSSRRRSCLRWRRRRRRLRPGRRRTSCPGPRRGACRAGPFRPGSGDRRQSGTGSHRRPTDSEGSGHGRACAEGGPAGHQGRGEVRNKYREHGQQQGRDQYAQRLVDVGIGGRLQLVEDRPCARDHDRQGQDLQP